MSEPKMKLSRRGLFGVFAGAGAAAVAPKIAMAAPVTEVVVPRSALATHEMICTTAIGGGPGAIVWRSMLYGDAVKAARGREAETI